MVLARRARASATRRCSAGGCCRRGPERNAARGGVPGLHPSRAGLVGDRATLLAGIRPVRTGPRTRPARRTRCPAPASCAHAVRIRGNTVRRVPADRSGTISYRLRPAFLSLFRWTDSSQTAWGNRPAGRWRRCKPGCCGDQVAHDQELGAGRHDREPQEVTPRHWFAPSHPTRPPACRRARPPTAASCRSAAAGSSTAGRWRTSLHRG